MPDVKYIKLFDLIERFPNKIDLIKEQYLLLLSELSITEYIETSLFKKNMERIQEIGGTIIIGYIGELINDSFEIIASGTIIIEPKIIRGGTNVGHIEDVVVAKVMRGQGICQRILDILKRIARENNCYKVILDCSEDVQHVYEKNGFVKKGIQMAEYF